YADRRARRGAPDAARGRNVLVGRGADAGRLRRDGGSSPRADLEPPAGGAARADRLDPARAPGNGGKRRSAGPMSARLAARHGATEERKLSKGYRPAEVEVEANHYARWEQAGYFAPSGRGEPYCIVIPPPNVTGTLHMGHAFQHTIMDALIRWHRMLGRNVLWQPGTDHAGIATQMVVERLLNAEGTSRQEIGRERF